MPPLYDVHTHVGLDPGFYLRGWWPYASTATDLVAQMDRHGIVMMILSLNAPAIQAILDPARADDIARKANDFLAAEVTKRPVGLDILG